MDDWAAVLHGTYLGQAAMGFRSQAGALFVAQLLSDLMAHRKQINEELWLVSFDIEEAYNSVPWCALFGSCGMLAFRSHWWQCLRTSPGVWSDVFAMARLMVIGGGQGILGCMAVRKRQTS